MRKEEISQSRKGSNSHAEFFKTITKLLNPMSHMKQWDLYYDGGCDIVGVSFLE